MSSELARKNLIAAIPVAAFAVNLLLPGSGARGDTVGTGERREWEAEIISYGKALVAEKLADADIVGGVSVALVNETGTVWSDGFGWASKSEQRPMTPDTSMVMGSVSKVVTAIALMQLVERSQIDLNAPYSEYVPALNIKSHDPAWPEFTIQHMLHHSAGLPGDYANGFYLEDPTDAATAYRALPEKASNLYLANPPERVHGYSNLAFSLLGLLVETVSGVAFPEYVKENILDPLGMKHSSFLNDSRVRSRLSKGNDGDRELGYEYIRDLAAGSLVATANDMALLLIALLNNGERILAADTLHQMFTQQNEQTASFDVSAPEMGLGFCLTLPGRLKGRPVAWHNGGLRTDYALFIVLPEDGLGIAIMASSPIAPIVDEIAENLLTKAIELRTGQKVTTVAEKSTPLSGQEKRGLSGYYFAGVETGLWQIATHGKRLFVRTQEDERLDLVPTSESTFRLEYKLFGLFPIAVEELAPLRITARRNVRGELGLTQRYGFLTVITGGHLSRTEPVGIPPSWMAMTGDYRIEQATKKELAHRELLGKSSTVKLVFEEDSGLLLFDGIPIHPIDDDHALSMGVGRGLGETIEVLPGGRRLFVSGHYLSKFR